MLDGRGVTDVRFIKAEVEGSGRGVREGARATIARVRSSCSSLLSGTHEDPGACTASASAMTPRPSSADAGSRRCRRSRRSARTPAGGTDIETGNVLFLPR